MWLAVKSVGVWRFITVAARKPTALVVGGLTRTVRRRFTPIGRPVCRELARSTVATLIKASAATPDI